MEERELEAKAALRERDSAAEPTHSEDGVDLTLIRWMLSLTPAERLQVLQGTIRSFERLREMEVSPGHTIKVLDLASIIALKEELAGEKDKAVIPVLRRTLEECNRRD